MEKKLACYYSRIGRCEKAAFFTVLILGFISHVHIFSVNYIFHDSTILDGLGATYSSGRWALGFCHDIAQRLLGTYQLPFINGFISLLFIALSVLLLVNALEIKSVICAVFVGAAVVSFPSVASHFAFMFTAPAYFLSMLLGTAAVALANKKATGFSFVAGASLTAFSIGIYQAYLSFAISFALVIVIVYGLREQADFSAMLKKGLFFVSMLICGLLLYLLINKAVLAIKGIELTTYQGLDRIGRIDFALVPNAVLRSYSELLEPKWTGIITSFFEKRVTLIIVILGSLLFLRLLRMSKAGAWAKVLLLLLAVISPLALNSVYLMAPGSMNGVHSLMRMSLTFCYILPAVYVELLLQKLDPDVKISPDKIIVSCTVFILCLVPVMYCYRDNTAYLNAELAEEQAEAYLGSMVTRIRSTEGYRDELPVAYIGFGISDSTFDRLPTYGDIYTYILHFSLEDMLNTDLWEEFCALHLGWSPKEVENKSYYSSLEQVQQMPCYPDDGSIQVIEDAIVVKFSN